MEHFAIIQALCRAALSSPSPAIIKQVERLKNALEKGKEIDHAKALESLLSSTERVVEMAPSRISRSAFLIGQELTINTPLPVDRETSIPLAEIVFVDKLPKMPPIMDEEVNAGIMALLDEWKHFDALAALDIHPSRSCLFFGAPGTGKTHLALWVARQLELPVVLARLDGLMSSYLGTTARNIGALFAFVAKYRCLLLLDEFDAIAKQRDDPQEVGEIKRVVNTLLQNLDSRRNVGLTIGITNHQALLDPAIWRRFEVQVEIPRPSITIIPALLEKFLDPLSFDATEIQLMTWVVEGGTGADIESFAQWLKKMEAFGDKKSLIAQIRGFAVLNASRVAEDRRISLSMDDENLIKALVHDEKYDFKQKDLAQVFGRSRSTVSRMISKK